MAQPGGIGRGWHQSIRSRSSWSGGVATRRMASETSVTPAARVAGGIARVGIRSLRPRSDRAMKGRSPAAPSRAAPSLRARKGAPHRVEGVRRCRDGAPSGGRSLGCRRAGSGGEVLRDYASPGPGALVRRGPDGAPERSCWGLSRVGVTTLDGRTLVPHADWLGTERAWGSAADGSAAGWASLDEWGSELPGGRDAGVGGPWAGLEGLCGPEGGWSAGPRAYSPAPSSRPTRRRPTRPTPPPRQPTPTRGARRSRWSTPREEGPSLRRAGGTSRGGGRRGPGGPWRPASAMRPSSSRARR